MPLTRQIGTRVYIAAMALAALSCFVLSMFYVQFAHPAKFLCYLAAALLASVLKVTLPDIESTMSMNFLLTLICILELGLPETLIIGVLKTLLQFYWRPARQPKPIQLVFNLSQVTVCCAAAYGSFELIAVHNFHGAIPLGLLAAAVTHFVCNTIAMSIIIGLTEEKSVRKVWTEIYLWTFPYYLVGAAIAGFIGFVSGQVGWQTSLLVLPPIYLMYRSSQLYLGKLESEKIHAQKLSKLHLRTIEALALAIEAKDQTTGEHLQRVRIYAMELARELQLTEDETEALQAASVLHDIGKLAVPEHIIAKPGKLTPEEFEKMKIHPIVGAEILEQVDFPYPVVPIVRAHHEKWDGSGYPYGLKGEAIPIGARILSAVDCLDALASDRQYRKALPLDDAMAKVVSESGISFDPRVVEVLQRRYVELENLATQQPLQTPPKLSTDIKVERGLAPDAGFAESEKPRSVVASSTYSSAMAAARRETQALLELKSRLGSSLSLDDLLALLLVRARQLMPSDSMAIYAVRNKVLVPEVVSGENFRLFSSLRIPVGEGLSGWVAENAKPILNGNPSVEPGYLNDETKYSTLRSALAVPLNGSSGVVAVLALYRIPADAFSREELNLLQTAVEGLGVAIEGALPREMKAAHAGAG
ncbi:MAG TPA: HD domain-containing phosphohydrolase [Candidatus Aquilonibacter sp.]|nr:HD domain-containing phosphohydrolase [Candidatus Aquilonibacter sp.]